MTYGQTLYLLMTLGSFLVFMATLAFYTSRYTPRSRALPRAAERTEPPGASATVH